MHEQANGEERTSKAKGERTLFHFDTPAEKGMSGAAEYAALQTLREHEDAWELAKPLDCAASPRFGLARWDYRGATAVGLSWGAAEACPQYW
jgi:hypothetical protein